MVKNIVICSDGTGNTFSEHVSNITLLIKSVKLCKRDEQIVYYDQGLGTNPKLVTEVEAYKSEPGKNRGGLEILPAPQIKFLRPLTRIRGLFFGYGLRDNVKEMYQALAENYEEGNQIFLFGFSRGAFTVRVLAGLVYRCGLPPKNVANNPADFEKCFSEAYGLYEPHREDMEKINEFKRDYQVRDRDIRIRFLGIWDTVKSYGGLIPQSLPHLRHNPIVNTVCHALALDEHRSWFVHTTWGWLDIDRKNLQFIKPDERYEEQQIKEVWFRGFHSDVGGGDDEKDNAEIPLRWMLREAKGCGLVLNQAGEDIVSAQDRKAPPPHESRRRFWPIADLLPRIELDNEHRGPDGGPGRLRKWGRTGKRDADKFRRNEYLCLHSSVGNSYNLEKVCCETEPRATFIPKLPPGKGR